jgi:hypothetical protein
MTASRAMAKEHDHTPILAKWCALSAARSPHEPSGRAEGAPDDKLRDMREKKIPDIALMSFVKCIGRVDPAPCGFAGVCRVMIVQR